jgi:hypothetical protein
MLRVVERPPDALRRFRTATYDPDKPLAFMHVPKTSGTAMAAALRNVLRPRFPVAGFDRSLFGAFTEFSSFMPSAIEGFRSGSELGASDFVYGHIALSTLLENCSRAQLLTVLREPRSRLLSHWLFWRSKGNEELREWGVWAERICTARLPLRDFLASPGVASAIDNVAVRMLLWPHPLIPDAGFIDSTDDERLLRDALARLDRFSFVDVMENPHFRPNLQAWLGRRVGYPHLNVTKNVPRTLRSPLDLDPSARERLAMRSRLDLALWTHVARRRVAPHSVSDLATRAFARNLDRYARLMR